jgi:hypothetical protein
MLIQTLVTPILKSAKGADARRHTAKKLRSSSGGAPSAQPGCGVVRTSIAAATVLREFLSSKRRPRPCAINGKRNFGGLGRGSRVRCAAKFLPRLPLFTTLTVVLGLGTHAQPAGGELPTPVLLELFTSEGCSSCPPADKLLQMLDDKQPFSGASLIVLSEHVDYWNTNKWTDPYSSKLFSARQQSYADRFGLDDVYTPQIVVDGQYQAVGGNAVEIRRDVESSIHTPKIALTLSNAAVAGGRIKLHLSTATLPPSAGSVRVYVAIAENSVQSNVAGGENGGRKLTHVAVVRTLARVGPSAAAALSRETLAYPYLPAHPPPDCEL